MRVIKDRCRWKVGDRVLTDVQVKELVPDAQDGLQILAKEMGD
jgi:hypothetical protein